MTSGRKNFSKPVKPIYAAVDIGSNNIRIALYGIDAFGEVVEVEIKEQTKFTCGLSEGMSEERHVIKEKNLKEAEVALRAIANIFKTYKIKTKNIEAVATAALRAVEGTPEGDKAIKRLRHAFHPYSFQVIRKEEEAKLVYEAACLDPVYQLIMSTAPEDAPKDKAFAAIVAAGGGSTEIDIVNGAGQLLYGDVIDQGMRTLKAIKDKEKSVAKAGDHFQADLEATHLGKVGNLFFVGGIFRAEAKNTCKSKMPFLLGFKKICHTFAENAQLSVHHFRQSPDESVRERAPFLAIAAEISGRVVKHTKAERICFLSKKMVDAIGMRIHSRHAHP